MQQPQTTTNDHNQPQTISKQPRTTTNYQPRKPNYQQTATPVYQTENLTFRFFFLDLVITRNTPILKNSMVPVRN